MCKKTPPFPSWVGLVTDPKASPDTGVHRATTAGLVTLRSIAVGNRAQFLAMNRAISVNGLKPVIDRVFPFEEAKAAYRYYQEAQPFGKVIINQS